MGKGGHPARRCGDTALQLSRIQPRPQQVQGESRCPPRPRTVPVGGARPFACAAPAGGAGEAEAVGAAGGGEARPGAELLPRPGLAAAFPQNISAQWSRGLKNRRKEMKGVHSSGT